MSVDRRHGLILLATGLAALLWTSAGAAGFTDKKRDVTLPEPGADLTAYRVDVDVWGWNSACSEMGALGSEVRRGREGEHRGEQFILIFPVDSLIPKENVHAGLVTQPALPDNPQPLDDIRDSMWVVSPPFLRMFPVRPKRKHFAGAMLIQPIWESLEVEPGICRPAVGFVLKYQGRQRYQPLQELRLAASCADLRLTDTRTYWAKKDVGAVMMRFDYSPNDNEMSVRFPISAAWKLGRDLKIRLETGAAAKSPAAKKVRDILATYGSVVVQKGPTGDGWVIRHRPELQTLAHRLRRELNAHIEEGPVPEGVDLLIIATTADTAASPTDLRPSRGPSPKSSVESQPTCGGLLRDCP
jgi:hypothetical protein